jgi:PTS system nitrogen regulatory IIA component
MVNLEKQCIILELDATSKDGVLRELAGVAHAQHPLIGQDSLHEILAEREQLGSTGVGSGVAIPHGKVPGIEKLLLYFGRSSAGISYDAVDNRPVHLIVMILAPPDMAEKYLNTLARVSRLLKDPDRKNKLLQATEADTIVDLFNNSQ